MLANRQARRAFTLVELLVVIAIIGMLLAMLLPAVQSAREAGRRAKCTSNMHNLGIALNSHMSLHGCFPPGAPTCTQPQNQAHGGGTQANGSFCEGPNWAMAILSQIDERDLAQRLTDCLNTGNGSGNGGVYNACDECEQLPTRNWDTGLGVGRRTPKVMLCPSAPEMTIDQRLGAGDLGTDCKSTGGCDKSWDLELISKGNYAANFGAGRYYDAVSAFWGTPQERKVTLPDGSIQTARQRVGAFDIVSINDKTGRAAYLSIGQFNHSAHDNPLRSLMLGSKQGNSDAAFKDGMTSTLMLSEVVGYNSWIDLRGAWTAKAMGASAFSAWTGPNSDVPDAIGACDPLANPKCIQARNMLTTDNPSDATYSGNNFAAARSAHPVGVVVCMADGSAKFVEERINLDVWKAMATRAGVRGEPRETE